MNEDLENFNEDVLRHEFDAIDTSGDGSLDADELLAVFQKLGKDVKKGTIMNLVRLADEDGNGTIEWEEFAKIFEVAQRCGLAPAQPKAETPKKAAESEPAAAPEAAPASAPALAPAPAPALAP